MALERNERPRALTIPSDLLARNSLGIHEPRSPASKARTAVSIESGAVKLMIVAIICEVAVNLVAASRVRMHNLSVRVRNGLYTLLCTHFDRGHECVGPLAILVGGHRFESPVRPPIC